GDRRPRTPRERAPEGPGVEVEAAYERHARVREQPVVERLLGRRERTAAAIEGDAAAGAGAGVERDNAVHGLLRPARRAPRDSRSSAAAPRAGSDRSRRRRSRYDDAPRRTYASRSVHVA